MSIETTSLFSQVIHEHLELKRQNAELEPAMPINRYRGDDPCANHPLFKSEEQARLEETMDGIESPAAREPVLAWPGEDSVELAPADADGLWGRSRDFDWGD